MAPGGAADFRRPKRPDPRARRGRLIVDSLVALGLSCIAVREPGLSAAQKQTIRASGIAEAVCDAAPSPRHARHVMG